MSLDLQNYVFQDDSILVPVGNRYPVTCPVLGYKNINKKSNFITSWWAVTEPFIMEHNTVWHDFDQLLFFCGGDITNMNADLGGKVEFHLGDEKGNMEKLIITKPTVIYVKAGMHHCPTKFLEIYDPKKPIFFQDITLSGVYSRFRPGSNVRINEKDEPI